MSKNISTSPDLAKTCVPEENYKHPPLMTISDKLEHFYQFLISSFHHNLLLPSTWHRLSKMPNCPSVDIKYYLLDPQPLLNMSHTLLQV